MSELAPNFELRSAFASLGATEDYCSPQLKSVGAYVINYNINNFYCKVLFLIY